MGSHFSSILSPTACNDFQNLFGTHYRMHALTTFTNREQLILSTPRYLEFAWPIVACQTVPWIKS